MKKLFVALNIAALLCMSACGDDDDKSFDPTSEEVVKTVNDFCTRLLAAETYNDFDDVNECKQIFQHDLSFYNLNEIGECGYAEMKHNEVKCAMALKDEEFKDIDKDENIPRKCVTTDKEFQKLVSCVLDTVSADKKKVVEDYCAKRESCDMFGEDNTKADCIAENLLSSLTYDIDFGTEKYGTCKVGDAIRSGYKCEIALSCEDIKDDETVSKCYAPVDAATKCADPDNDDR